MPRVAIVIPVLNQLAYTQGCLRCLQPDLDAGVRVIVVDNGSTDGTPAWLAERSDVEVIRNDTNRGCAPAWNQGVTAAGLPSSPANVRNTNIPASPSEPSLGANVRNTNIATELPPLPGSVPEDCDADNTARIHRPGAGPDVRNTNIPDWVVVLNNDVLLPGGWLAALLGAAERHGLDIVCPAMRERDQNYDFATHARDYMDRLGGVVRHGGAHGVCFAVRRAVFERIGGFDEAFRIGQFEDADFFRRAKLAGFRTGIVGACFIHHFGSVTQDALSDTNRKRPYEEENRAYFRKKWKLGWARRRWEKAGQAVHAWWWRTTERTRFGRTLHEKWGGDRVLFY